MVSVFFKIDRMQGSMQEFMPLDDLHKKNQAYAINHRKKLEDEVPADTGYLQTRLQKKKQAEFVEYFEKNKKGKILDVDRFIGALPGMLSDAKNHAEKKKFGPEELWKMRPHLNCCCVEKTGSCYGHVFEMDQYFLAASDYHQSGCVTPDSPRSPE